MVEQFELVERLIHEELTEFRINKSREFFICSVEHTVATVRRLIKERNLFVEADHLTDKDRDVDHCSAQDEADSPMNQRQESKEPLQVMSKCPKCGCWQTRDVAFISMYPVIVRCDQCYHKYRDNHNNMRQQFLKRNK